MTGRQPLKYNYFTRTKPLKYFNNNLTPTTWLFAGPPAVEPLANILAAVPLGHGPASAATTKILLDRWDINFKFCIKTDLISTADKRARITVWRATQNNLLPQPICALGALTTKEL